VGAGEAAVTPLQKRIVLALAIVIGLTRFAAVAHSLFDWDEAQFALGVRNYDVPNHRPHPPGYPLFIAAAKVVHLTGLDEFRSLQLLVVLSALCVFPALFFLARELGFPFETAVAGAAIYAFLPNVWTYGGTAFSDVPATVLALVACALLLRGREDGRAYIAGAVVLGLAAAIRPANLLVGVVPALLATWCQLLSSRASSEGSGWVGRVTHASRPARPGPSLDARDDKPLRLIAIAMLSGLLVLVISYGGAALASGGVRSYLDILRVQSKYVHDVDSWHSPTRGPLYDAAKVFLVSPIGQDDLRNTVVIAAALALVAALVRRRRAPLLAVAVFAPLAVLSWLNLDINAAGRYAIGYMAVHALLTAEAFRLFGRWAQGVLATAMIGVLIAVTWPALRTQRTTDAPPAAALQWIARNVPPAALIFVHGSMRPHAAYFLPRHHLDFYDDADDITATTADAWMVDWRTRGGAHNFVRPHNALWNTLRRRGFEASVSSVQGLIRFGEGWYEAEGPGTDPFHWMASESVTILPAVPGRGTLSLRIYVPLDRLPVPPTIEVRWNGELVDRFAGTPAESERTWTLASRSDAPNELRIRTSATVNLSHLTNSTDTRDLGLRVNRLTWSARKAGF
jgi:hypothetical protein